MNKMEESELKKIILDEMCWFAENPNRGNKRTNAGRLMGVMDLFGNSIALKAFKPGLADKLLFKQIIEDYHEEIDKLLKRVNKSDPAMVTLRIYADTPDYAFHFMVHGYYMNYF
jgi:hypothetical protein